MADGDPLGSAVHLDPLSRVEEAGADTEAARALESRLGYTFKAPGLLQEALTHGSATGSGRRAPRSNERLEFLGDRVLGLIVADLLIRRFPDEPEGALTRRFHALVAGPTLAEIAAEIGLGEALRLSISEGEAGRRRPAILADALEALLGAVYLDGGLGAAAGIVHGMVEPRIDTLSEAPREPKSTLQEWAQARGLALPVYEVVGQEGPAHAPAFEVQVRLEGRNPERGRGPSKRSAEQAAAIAMLQAIENDGD